MHEPFELSAHQIARLPVGGTGSFDVSLGFKASAGEVWGAKDGQRLIHLITGDQCVYVLVQPIPSFSLKAGFVFQQSMTGMRGHLQNAHADEVGRRNQATQRVIKAHVEFMMGVAKAVSGPVRLAGYAASALDWTLRNKQNISRWYRVAQVVLEIKGLLKTFCPSLHDKVIAVLLAPLLGDPDLDLSKVNPDLLMRGVGRWTAKRTPDLVESDVKPIKDLVKEVLTPVIKHMVKYATKKLLESQYSDLAYHVFRTCGKAAKLKPGEAEQIIREVSENGPQLEGPIAKLEAALDGR